MNLLALTHHNGIRIAELGFAVAAVGGALLAFGALSPRAGGRGVTVLAGLALAAGAILVIVAAHWGHFG
jgi:hypothetical protein